jgi:hypothetical protein
VVWVDGETDEQVATALSLAVRVEGTPHLDLLAYDDCVPLHVSTVRAVVSGVTTQRPAGSAGVAMQAAPCSWETFTFNGYEWVSESDREAFKVADTLLPSLMDVMPHLTRLEFDRDVPTRSLITLCTSPRVQRPITLAVRRPWLGMLAPSEDPDRREAAEQSARRVQRAVAQAGVPAHVQLDWL